MSQVTPTFGLYSTAEGGAAYVARDLLEISSHIFKPEVRSVTCLCCFECVGPAAAAWRLPYVFAEPVYSPCTHAVQVQRRLRACLETSLPLASLPAAAADAGRAVEEARYDEAVPVSWWALLVNFDQLVSASCWVCLVECGQHICACCWWLATWIDSHVVMAWAWHGVLTPSPAWAASPPVPLQRLPKSSWRDVHYKGDPMLRPITSFEIGLLVRLLVALSVRLNAALGLTGGSGGSARGGGAQQQQQQQREQQQHGEEEEDLAEHRLQVRREA